MLLTVHPPAHSPKAFHCALYITSKKVVAEAGNVGSDEIHGSTNGAGCYGAIAVPYFSFDVSSCVISTDHMKIENPASIMTGRGCEQEIPGRTDG